MESHDGAGLDGAPVVANNRFVTVSVGHNHACALRTDKPIACWGSNRYGESDSPRTQAP